MVVFTTPVIPSSASSGSSRRWRQQWFLRWLADAPRAEVEDHPGDRLRGDFQPYLALQLSLQKAGHELMPLARIEAVGMKAVLGRLLQLQVQY